CPQRRLHPDPGHPGENLACAAAPIRTTSPVVTGRGQCRTLCPPERWRKGEGVPAAKQWGKGQCRTLCPPERWRKGEGVPAAKQWGRGQGRTLCPPERRRKGEGDPAPKQWGRGQRRTLCPPERQRKGKGSPLRSSGVGGSVEPVDHRQRAVSGAPMRVRPAQDDRDTLTRFRSIGPAEQGGHRSRRSGLHNDPQLVPEVLLSPDDVLVRDQHRLRSEEHTSELQSRENLVCR